jgi:hypothetical protein
LHICIELLGWLYLFVYLRNKHLSVAIFLFSLMSSRILAFTLVALLVFGVSSMALGGSVYAQGDDNWYPGEGIQADTYYKYNIREYQTNNRQFFELTLYFQEQQDGDWIVPAFVVDEGKVIRGTWKLSDSMGYLAGSSQVPPEMNQFVGGYLGSLHWIDSFTTKADPKSLNSGNWGRTGSIGGSDLKPSGRETIRVPAGEYETTVLVLHKGQADSKIWIKNEFPFPIKALFFTDTTTGAPETQFEFELLETGKGQPEPPAEEERIPTPPLDGKTGRGTYEISLDWEPTTIEPGSPVSFTVRLADSTGFPLERANYDFTIKDSEGNVIQEFLRQNADVDSGIGTHEVQIDSAGPVMVTVKINSVSGQDTGQFIESVDFNVVVVPEFPVSAALVAAAVIGLVVVMTRAKGGLGSLFGSRGPF